jgi:hypothetical protein
VSRDLAHEACLASCAVQFGVALPPSTGNQPLCDDQEGLYAAGGQWQVSDYFLSPSVASICATAEGCEVHHRFYPSAPFIMAGMSTVALA